MITRAYQIGDRARQTSLRGHRSHPAVLGSLGSRLVFWHQVPEPSSPHIVLDIDGKCVQFRDRVGSAHLTPWVNPVPYFPNGGPNDQPYLQNTSPVIYDESLSTGAATALVPDGQRLAFYVVGRLGDDTPTEAASTLATYNDAFTNFPFKETGYDNGDLFASAQSGGNYQALVCGKHENAWHVLEVSYLSTGCEARVNGVLAITFPFSGPADAGALWVDMIYRQDDAIAFGCCVLDPDAESKAIVTRHIRNTYGLAA